MPNVLHSFCGSYHPQISLHICNCCRTEIRMHNLHSFVGHQYQNVVDDRLINSLIYWYLVKELLNTKQAENSLLCGRLPHSSCSALHGNRWQIIYTLMSAWKTMFHLWHSSMHNIACQPDFNINMTWTKTTIPGNLGMMKCMCVPENFFS